MVSKGNHPQMALIQGRENYNLPIQYIYIYIYIYIFGEYLEWIGAANFL